MAVTGYVYPLGITRAYSGDIDVDGHTIKCALLTSNYSPNLQTQQSWSTISDDEVSGSGYTGGGVTLGDAAVGLKSGTSIFQFWSNDCQWENSTITARYAVIYDSNTSYLICYIDFGENKVSSSGLFKLDFDQTEGIFQIS